MRINWLNYKFIATDGYGRYGILFIRALMRAGVGVTPGLVEQLQLPGDLLRMSGLDFSRLTIALMPPHELRAVPGRLINYTMYESTRLRRGWVDQINTHCERVLVPAPWLVEVMDSHDCTVPVHVVPGGIDPEEFPVITRNGNRPYTFLALGDRGSRKGWDIAWRAFYQAFGDDPNVRLVIKMRMKPYEGAVHLDMSHSDSRVSVWSGDAGSMADVYAHADCFVFPTRAEGWGLPPREAAATGMPVICTAWSGTEVGIEHWGIPIRTFKMVNACVEAQPYPNGKPAQWAQPDVDETADHMRWCYDHQDEARALGLRSAQWLRDNQTWDHAARVMMDLLDGRDNGAHE